MATIGRSDVARFILVHIDPRRGLMRIRNLLGSTAILLSAATCVSGQVVSGVMNVTGAEMH